MQMSDLKPAKLFAMRFGVKSIVYGRPGTGKTPLISTAPRPVIAAIEPGFGSMRHSEIPTWDASTPARFSEFIDWLSRSHEAKNFDTVGVDSLSQGAENILLDVEESGTNRKHPNFNNKFSNGLAAYGEMSRRMMEIVNTLFYMPNKHAYLIAKLEHYDEGNMTKLRPKFPGKDLNSKIPHLFDEILFLDRVAIPGLGTQLAFRTSGTIDVLARDRSGTLNELEPPNFGEIIRKCMA